MNLTITRWLSNNHPQILQEFLNLKKEHKRRYQRETSREIYRLAKEAKAKAKINPHN